MVTDILFRLCMAWTSAHIPSSYLAESHTVDLGCRRITFDWQFKDLYSYLARLHSFLRLIDKHL